jgi:hypothetical protein
MSQDKSS